MLVTFMFSFNEKVIFSISSLPNNIILHLLKFKANTVKKQNMSQKMANVCERIEKVFFPFSDKFHNFNYKNFVFCKCSQFGQV